MGKNPGIYMPDPAGGDPRCVADIKRIYRLDDLRAGLGQPHTVDLPPPPDMRAVLVKDLIRFRAMLRWTERAAGSAGAGRLATEITQLIGGAAL